MKWANQLSSLACHLISAADRGDLPRRTASVHLLIHSLTPSSDPTHTSPSGTEKGNTFAFLTPITHEVLIPYDGCQSPAVYASSTLLFSLISLSCDYCYFFTLFPFQEPKGIGWLWCQLVIWLVGSSGHNVRDRQHYNPVGSLRSVLALTAGRREEKVNSGGKRGGHLSRSLFLLCQNTSNNTVKAITQFLV